MAPSPYRNASFVVRIWWEASSGGQAFWRGQVVHASTGQHAYFDDLAALLDFLQRWAGNLTAIPKGEEKRPPPDE